MSSVVVTGIAELVTCEPAYGREETQHRGLGLLREAAVVIDGDQLSWAGPAAAAPAADRSVDVGGRCVTPAFVDSHTHLVFAGDRAAEFAARMSGTAYDGGGIASTVQATRAAGDAELRVGLAGRVAELRAQGTGVVEIKSGYGLDAAQEARLLRLAGEVTAETTYLGAHVIPPALRDDRGRYLDLVTGEMLAACAPYARWIDVFCEPHSRYAFDGDEARVVLEAGVRAGLGLRVHGNQLGHGPGVRLAVEMGAACVDHCTYLRDEDVDALAASSTVAGLLPGVEFSTRSPYPDARRLLDAGVQVSLATDCNPGTSATTSMPFVIALAVREMGMSPAEALLAATLGGARSLSRNDIGRIAPGAQPQLTVLDAPSYLHLAYRPGVPIARRLDLSAPPSDSPAYDRSRI